MVKKIKKSIIISVLIVFLVVLTSCNLFDGMGSNDKDPDTFDAFTNELLVTLVGGDEMTCNFFFNDRSVYGLENYEPSLPTPSVRSALSVAAINLLFGQIKNYNYDKLNDDQKMTYNLIVDLVDNINAQTSEMSYLDNTYLGSYLGYQAQLPLLLTEYHFRNKLDIENYLKYLELIPETFKSYYEFEVTKADKGYGMPNFVIDKVVDQCISFVEGIDNETSFMFKVIANKINDCSFLNETEKTTYIDLNKNYIKTFVKDGYLYLKNNLPTLKGRAIYNEGLATIYNKDGKAIGKEYYEIIFKDEVGYDISCADAITYVENKILEYKLDYIDATAKLKNNDKALKQMELIESNELFFMNNTPEEQLELYKTIIVNDFPALTVEPKINVNYIDESMQNNFSPAAYMTSPIDDITTEKIYLNPADIYLFDNDDNQTSTLDYNYLYNTLAHEGLPGHLYQTAYFKSLDVNPIRKLLKNSGYVEGWATYTEKYVYKYLKGKFEDEVIDYYIANSNLTAAIYSRLDLGIHYDGWSLEESGEFMKSYFDVNDDKVLKAYQQLIEIPTNYQKYFFTYMKFTDMYETVSSKLGNSFIDLEFHKTILDCGPAPLKYVEEVVYNKYKIK